MDFIGAIQTCFKNYANFKGVASRPEYWYFFLFLFLSGLVLNVVDKYSPAPVFGLIFNVITLLPSVAVLIRRLRDGGFSWTWFLAPLISGLIFMVSLVIIFVVSYQNGLFSFSEPAPSDAQLRDSIRDFFDANPSFLILALVMLASAVLLFASWLVVQIILPALPSKSFEQGNRRVAPNNPVL